MGIDRLRQIKRNEITTAEVVGNRLILKRWDGSTEIFDPDVGFVSEEEFLTQGPSGRELDHAESSVAVTGIGATAVDLPGLVVEFEVVNRPVYVEVDLPWVTASAAAGTLSAVIADEENTSLRFGPRAFAASQTHSLRVVERISTPGLYTRKARLQRAAGSATFNYNMNLETVVATISAVER